ADRGARPQPFRDDRHAGQSVRPQRPRRARNDEACGGVRDIAWVPRSGPRAHQSRPSSPRKAGTHNHLTYERAGARPRLSARSLEYGSPLARDDTEREQLDERDAGIALVAAGPIGSMRGNARAAPRQSRDRPLRRISAWADL